MMELLNSLGPAIWRASWQAGVLALLVAALLWCCGERLAPRWRFLMWSVVVLRLLVILTPASPWSAFNLLSDRHVTRVSAPVIATRSGAEFNREIPQNLEKPVAESFPSLAVEGHEAAALPSVIPAKSDSDPGVVSQRSPLWWHSVPSLQVVPLLTAIWLAGCLVLGVRTLLAVWALQRRLSTCRAVNDAEILQSLKTLCSRIRVRSSPQLVVTPECISPCLAGFWRPRIVLPETLLTESSPERLRHVMAHELAHLVRGDALTNWLLLAARILHWFNPAAWWSVSAMLAEREADCDELALVALGESERTSFAATIVELAAGLAPLPLAPGMVGLFTSRHRLQSRVERLLRPASMSVWRSMPALGLLIVLGLCGLTDSVPAIQAQGPVPPSSEPVIVAGPGEFIITGICRNAGQTPLAGVSVRLYRSRGPAGTPEEIARTLSNAEGKYSFPPVERSRREWHLNRLEYSVLGFLENHAVGWDYVVETGRAPAIALTEESTTCSGRVVDANGRPVVGATVMRFWTTGYQHIPGVLSAVTSPSGLFEIKNVPVRRKRDGTPYPTSLNISHPDHPRLTTQLEKSDDLLIAMPIGCEVTGSVLDEVLGQPAAGAVVTLEILGNGTQAHVVTDGSGDYRLVVQEGKYKVLVAAKDRVGPALTDRECPAGETVKLPQLRLTGGGFITGQVLNSVTRQPVILSQHGGRITLGLFGPSLPFGNAIRQIPQSEVDDQGRFTIRAAPGENFPYFANTQGDRMAWDTMKQPPVVVKEGETTTYNMLITPQIPPAEKLETARKLLATFPQTPRERTERILAEFRKLSHTVDETELWCLLMRDLAGMGPAVVPQICEELDGTNIDRSLRRLAFALRAIGDPRAVPALVRALPRSIVGGGDYGLLVEDRELLEFMQAHDLDEGNRGTYFGFGSAVREVTGALRVLTRQSFQDEQIFQIHLSEDPRRQIMQRRIFLTQAQKWQQWWEQNWKTLTNDVAYSRCNLPMEVQPLPAAPEKLSANASTGVSISGAVLSPAAEVGRHAWHFYDLDTGYRPIWPEQVPRDESASHSPELAAWAVNTGVDLMCITQRQADGTDVFVLRALGMRVWEIDPRELRNLSTTLAAGKVPERRPVDGLLMHFDERTQQYQPDANAAFLFQTREGSWGVIDTTDRIIRTADLTGQAAMSGSSGVGFHLGVKFDLQEIVP